MVLRILLFACLYLSGLNLFAQQEPVNGSYQAINKNWLQVEIGIIGTASDDILEGALALVEKKGMAGLVVVLDTPGGALQSTRSMVKKIMSAPFPVVVWVGPSGAHAGSAGSFITLSGHIAAMAPGTNIGAAHPVQVTGQDIKEGEVSRKVENDTLAFMESIAQLRGRNTEMALSFVENSLSITAEEALDNKVIDMIANSVPQLMIKMDGQAVKLGDGNEYILSTKGASLELYEKSFRQQFLEILSNPNIFYLLFVAGLIGIGFELTHPGSLVPGVIGGICIVMSLIATSVLPVNFGAMLLILASIAFMVAEVFVPSFGILGIGGFLAFLVGSVLLVDSSNELGLRISWYTIIPGALLVASFGALVAYLVLRVERSKLKSGAETIIGREAEVIIPFQEGSGQVRLDGEIWAAKLQMEEALEKGQRVRIVKRDGLKLTVEPLSSLNH